MESTYGKRDTDICNWELLELLNPEYSEKFVNEEFGYHKTISNHHFSKFILFSQRMVHSHIYFQIAEFTHTNMWSDSSNLKESMWLYIH
jgi:hypothetical protein